MSKHTAGPWEIKKSPFEVYNTDHGALTHQVNSGHTMIAALYVHHESHDARLIAAAPDMLEALQAFMSYNDDGDDGVDMMLRYAKALEMSRAAIAKALGGDHE